MMNKIAKEKDTDGFYAKMGMRIILANLWG